MYKCTEEEFKICENNAKCIMCDGKRLFKKPKWMQLREKQQQRKEQGIKKKKKEGMSFEKKVTKKYNKSLGANKSNWKDPASRRPNSGAIWSMPGDISTEEELMECKERGSRTSKGEKLITIQKQQLDKIKEEAYLAKKNIWYYVFGFKECDNIYVVKDYEDELAMLQQIKLLKARVTELEGRLEEMYSDED